MKPPSFEGDNPGKKDTWNISICDITKATTSCKVFYNWYSSNSCGSINGEQSK